MSNFCFRSKCGEFFNALGFAHVKKLVVKMISLTLNSEIPTLHFSSFSPFISTAKILVTASRQNKTKEKLIQGHIQIFLLVTDTIL